MIKVQLPTREHRLHELNLNYGDVVFFIGQNGSGKSSLLNNLFQKNRISIISICFSA